MRRGPSLLRASLALALLVAGCRRAEKAPETDAPPVLRSLPNVLFITVDTLRPDALGWVGGTNATPALDRFAREGFRFPAAVAPVPLTLPSHAAIFTGFLPRRLGLRDNGQRLGASPATLAEVLERRGFSTAAFISGYPVASEFGLDRGFDLYDDGLPEGSGEELERSARATTEAATAWLKTAPAPWFAWVHYYDPHFPYEPPAGFRRAGPRGAYDGEVAAVDRSFGDLRSGLGASRTDLLTVFAADHGESLGEHHEGTHGFFIYDSTVLVPLVFHLPGRIGAGESREPARLIDAAPTILDLLGLPPLPDADGISLLALLSRGRQTIPPAYVETYQPWTSYGWSPLRAVRHGGWKLIAAPRPELYRLDSDPGEESNLFDAGHEKARELQLLRTQLEARPAAEVASAAADSESLARLRSLGYLGAGGSSAEPPMEGLRDPKDGAGLRDLLTRGDLALRGDDPRSALPPFDAVLREDPENRFALLRSGQALLLLGRAEAAALRLEKAVRLDPERGQARSLLVDALVELGRLPAAAREAMERTRLQPSSAEAWAKLGNVLGLSGKPEEAVTALTRAVALEPEDPRWLARLAFAQHAAGRLEDAAASLARLAKRTGEQRFPHAGALGILLVQLGRREQALDWLRKSRPEEGDFAQARLELAILEAERGLTDGARRSLREAISAEPRLRKRARADPRLAPLLR